MQRVFVSILALVAALTGTVGALAQSYPTRPITIVVGFPPGGPTDTVARVIGEQIEKALGQTVVIENQSGAGGTIAGARVARSDPDGYTLNVGQWTTQVGAGGIYPLKYHVMDDFAPVAMLTSSYLWIIGRGNMPAKDLKELVAWLKANPGKGTAASVGVGSAAQMCLVDFANKSGTKFQYVPYRGGAPAMQDLLGGTVDFGCLEVSQTLPHVRAGKFKTYGVAAKKRSPAAPDTPTPEEACVPNVELVFWHGLWAPKGTPAAIIDKLNGAVRKAFADPRVKKRFDSIGHEIPSDDQLSPAALAKFHKAELDKWWPIMKEAGIRAPEAK